jgi:hypothetical protein
VRGGSTGGQGALALLVGHARPVVHRLDAVMNDADDSDPGLRDTVRDMTMTMS